MITWELRCVGATEGRADRRHRGAPRWRARRRAQEELEEVGARRARRQHLLRLGRGPRRGMRSDSRTSLEWGTTSSVAPQGRRPRAADLRIRTPRILTRAGPPRGAPVPASPPGIRLREAVRDRGPPTPARRGRRRSWCHSPEMASRPFPGAAVLCGLGMLGVGARGHKGGSTIPRRLLGSFVAVQQPSRDQLQGDGDGHRL